MTEMDKFAASIGRAAEIAKSGKYPVKVVHRAARAICEAWGENFEAIHRDKGHWLATGGHAAARFRDINEPRQADFLAMAESSIAAVPYAAMREALEAIVYDAEASPEWFSDSDCRKRCVILARAALRAADGE